MHVGVYLFSYVFTAYIPQSNSKFALGHMANLEAVCPKVMEPYVS